MSDTAMALSAAGIALVVVLFSLWGGR